MMNMVQVVPTCPNKKLAAKVCTGTIAPLKVLAMHHPVTAGPVPGCLTHPLHESLESAMHVWNM